MKRLLLLAVTICFFINFIHAQAGKLDSSFGTNGIVTTDLGEAHNLGSPPASQVLLQSDGSIYIVQESLSKRHANGSIDSSFGVNGFISYGYYDYIKAAIAFNGKIVILSRYSGEYALARYNTNGRPDSSFSNDGKQAISFNYENVTMAIQENGKIVVAGTIFNDSSYIWTRRILRYNLDGSLDTTFKAKDNLINPAAIAIQKDGKIVVTGSRSLITRFNIDGSSDNTFMSDTSYISIYDFAKIAVQSDGKIVIAGDGAIARFNADGSADKSFSDDGIQIATFPKPGFYEFTSMALQSDGKIVVAGYVSISTDGIDLGELFTVARYDTDGSFDSSFSKDGVLTTDFGIIYAKANTVAIRYDGKVMAGGEGENALVLAQYNADGTLDNTFNRNGKLIENGLSGNYSDKKVTVQKDGKIVAIGSKWNGTDFDFAIARYNTNGTPDNTFGNNGVQTTDFAFDNDYAKAVVIQKDGKIIVAGSNSLARYNTDGSLDKTFSRDGKIAGDSINITSLAIQNDGKIVAAGNEKIRGAPAVFRYNVDGSPDKTFGLLGSQKIESAYYDNRVFYVVIQSTGKIVVGGGHTTLGDIFGNYYFSSVYVKRLNENGSIDSTFQDFSQRTNWGYSLALALQVNDKIVLAVSNGESDDGKTAGSLLVRFNADGSTDNTFNAADRKFIDNSYNISSIAVQGNEKLVVAGYNLFRFNNNGSLDTTFGKDGIQTPPFSESITIYNNKLYTLGGDRYLSVARYQLDDNNNNTSPTVTLTAPANNATYLAPAAHIKLTATAADSGGKITKVEFYKDSTLLHTETVIPYGYAWRNVPLGNYTITAKAYDNSGNVTTSAPVHISVVPNKGPVVSIIKPANNQGYTTPAGIHFEAAAADTDGRITKVEFYNGSTLLRTEYKYPYTYNWIDVPAGTYTVTAVATDNWGAYTTSAPVTIIGTLESAIVSSKPSSENQKTALNDALGLRLSPNPAKNIVNIQTSGLQQGKPATLSIISLSGIVLKTMRISNAATQLDVSLFRSGVYTIKIVSGEKAVYKQFVRL